MVLRSRFVSEKTLRTNLQSHMLGEIAFNVYDMKL